MEPPAKRQAIDHHHSTALVDLNAGKPQEGEAAAASSLSSPTLRLERGHSGPILSCAFSPSGRLLASASKDRTVSLWDYTGDCSNTLVLKGHKNAVLRVAFLKGNTNGSGEELLATASADTTCALWDAPTGSRIRTFTGHTRIVNDVCSGGGDPHALLSASDDGFLILWDSRTRTPALYIPGSYPLLACSFGSLPTTLLGAGIEGAIHAYDTRALPSGGSGGGGGDGPSTPLFTLSGHLDAVSSLALSPTEDALLSLSFDGTARLWDVQPFSTHGEGRVRGCLAASPTTFEGGLVRGGWSPNGERVCGGGGDRLARVWDVDSGQVLALLGGHTGVCVEAAFHPKENVLATAGDNSIWLGELRY